MMPYTALLERLRRYLRQPSAVLTTVGYSYGDAHINAALLEGLRSNPSATVFALMYTGLDGAITVCELAEVQSNLVTLAADGAVVGRSRGLWSTPVKTEVPGGATEQGAPFNLGDFAAFARLLARQAGA